MGWPVGVGAEVGSKLTYTSCCVISRTLWAFVFATYMLLPVVSTKQCCGVLNVARRAGPPSPSVCVPDEGVTVPDPAWYVMI